MSNGVRPTPMRRSLSPPLLLAVIAPLALAAGTPTPPVIPRPVQTTPVSASTPLDPGALTRVRLAPEADAPTRRVAQFAATPGFLRPGKTLPITSEASPGAAVTLALTPGASASPEGYTLTVAGDGARIEAPAAAGLFHGLQTLRALCAGGAPVPAQVVKDAPRFAWRGLHLDESRHFFGKAFVKRTLDLMALHKLNVFHWHLTDGPGWRIEIPEYPKLTTVGAWRRDKTDRPWDWRATELSFDGRRPGDYGGFYTEADIREVVAYARERFITVVPEIEMPGHAYAALVAYPELACENTAVRTEGLRGKDVFCAGNPATFAFAETVLRRVGALFPDAPYLHIGGDEVSDLAWKNCPKCRARLKAIGGKDAHDLQADFTRRIADLLRRQGRRAMGWDEIIAGPGIPRDTGVMVWRDAAFARRALELGHPVVLTPISHLYFDLPERRVPGEPPGADGLTPLSKVYGYDPLDGLTQAQGKNLLGVQGCVWTEHITTPALADHRMLPRLCALAELAWSPAALRDEADFRRRLGLWTALLQESGYGSSEDRAEGPAK